MGQHIECSNNHLTRHNSGQDASAKCLPQVTNSPGSAFFKSSRDMNSSPSQHWVFCFSAPQALQHQRSCALQHQRLCFAASEVVLCSVRGEGFVLWSTRFCFAAPGGMGGSGVCALQHQARGRGEGFVFWNTRLCLQHQWGWGGTGWLCFAAPEEGRGEGFVLWSTRLSFAAPEKMGGKKGVVLCARGGERRGEGFVLCSTRGDGREQGGGALQR